MPRFGSLEDQYFDNAGNPLISGFIKVEESGGGADKETFVDPDLEILNPNPIPLSASGVPPNVWFNGEARMILFANDGLGNPGTQLRVLDPIPGTGTAGQGVSDFNAIITYNKPDIVIDDERFWQSIVNGNIGNSPTATTGFWMEVFFVAVYNEAFTYSINQQALGSDNITYTSLVSTNIGNDPTSTTGFWESPVTELIQAKDLTTLVNQFRMSLATGTPVTVTDVLGATTLFWTPYQGERVSIFTGTKWDQLTVAELSVTIPNTTNTMYDLFVDYNGGTLQLEFVVWADLFNRVTGLGEQNKKAVQFGSPQKLYVGSFSTAGSLGTSEESKGKHHLWNNYNRVKRVMLVEEPTASWNYTLAVIRQANASIANQLEFVVGIAEDEVEASVYAAVFNATGGSEVSVGIGLDVTTSYAAESLHPRASSIATSHMQISATYGDVVAAGRHFLSWNEFAEAVGTATWSSASSPQRQSGIKGSIFA